MTRYTYATECNPPAPFVHVTLRNPEGEATLTGLPAQLDTGADQTVLPQHLVDELGIPELRQREVTGLGGQTSFLSTYLVELTIRDLEPILVEVLAHSGEPFSLLGRDMLNRYRIVFDGPQLRLEIVE